MQARLKTEKRHFLWLMSTGFSMLAVYMIYVAMAFWRNLDMTFAEQTESSAGLREMSSTLSSFNPIYGIGIAIGLVVMFIALSGIIGLKAESK